LTSGLRWGAQSTKQHAPQSPRRLDLDLPNSLAADPHDLADLAKDQRTPLVEPETVLEHLSLLGVQFFQRLDDQRRRLVLEQALLATGRRVVHQHFGQRCVAVRTDRLAQALAFDVMQQCGIHLGRGVGEVSRYFVAIRTATQ